eukprot:GSChrysophyteH1.ASY1.ANO1.1510.1 assembled CDS
MEALQSLERSDTDNLEQPYKRQRQGSISGKLRTASDLEERGFISKAEKGIMKDLIISGDKGFQTVMDKLGADGDRSELHSHLKAQMKRRGSIDLLEHMDLDLAFLGNDGKDTIIDSNLGFRGLDDLLSGTTSGKPISGRSSSITSTGGIFGNMVPTDIENTLLQFSHGVFDDSGGNQVEMSAYENVAKTLSAQKERRHMMRGTPGDTPSSLHSSHSEFSSSRSTALYNAEGIDASPSATLNHLAWVKRVEGSEGKLFIGAYSPDQRKKRIERFIEKRSRRVWTKKVKYDVRKNFADSRLRVKGRFVKKEDEEIMRELMSI